MHDSLRPHLGEVTQAMSITCNQALPAGFTPDSVPAALALMDACVGYLRDPGAASLLPPELGGTLETLGVLSGKLAAAKAAILNRFDAERAYIDDGYGSTSAWLKGKAR